ncbi:putative autophagy-related protein 11 [Hydra vulgaris]|uniref:putative autophagy-related protein 11 n=1 Tax=Hydra vulgaris TaxID=6087 RepID=UPI001F5FD748|nr:putative autophagy-related protein 11 [Hydra vulgaris]XP_047124369.1 putative autophagy-related protein 11 [Hydra vulgaris]
MDEEEKMKTMHKVEMSTKERHSRHKSKRDIKDKKIEQVVNPIDDNKATTEEEKNLHRQDYKNKHSSHQVDCQHYKSTNKERKTSERTKNRSRRSKSETSDDERCCTKKHRDKSLKERHRRREECIRNNENSIEEERKRLDSRTRSRPSDHTCHRSPRTKKERKKRHESEEKMKNEKIKNKDYKTKDSNRLYHSDSELEVKNRKKKSTTASVPIDVDGLYNLFYRDSNEHNESGVIKEAIRKKLKGQETSPLILKADPNIIKKKSSAKSRLDAEEQSNVKCKLIRVLFQRVKELLKETEVLRVERKEMCHTINLLNEQIKELKKTTEKILIPEKNISDRLEILAEEMKVTTSGTSFREEIHNILYDIQNKYQTHWKEHEHKLQEVQSQAENEIQALMKNIVGNYIKLADDKDYNKTKLKTEISQQSNKNTILKAGIAQQRKNHFADGEVLNQKQLFHKYFTENILKKKNESQTNSDISKAVMNEILNKTPESYNIVSNNRIINQTEIKHHNLPLHIDIPNYEEEKIYQQLEHKQNRTKQGIECQNKTMLDKKLGLLKISDQQSSSSCYSSEIPSTFIEPLEYLRNPLIQSTDGKDSSATLSQTSQLEVDKTLKVNIPEISQKNTLIGQQMHNSDRIPYIPMPPQKDTKFLNTEYKIGTATIQSSKEFWRQKLLQPHPIEKNESDSTVRNIF